MRKSLGVGVHESHGEQKTSSYWLKGEVELKIVG